MRQINTKIALGINMSLGGSCGVRGRLLVGGPKNTCAIKRNEYATLNTLASTAIMGKAQLNKSPLEANMVSVKNISLEIKPLSKGTPAMEAAATEAKVAVIGM